MLRIGRLLAVFLAAACSARADDVISTRLVAPPDPLSYYDRSGEGIRLFMDGKYADAERALEQLVKEYPIDGRTWLYLGMTKHTLRKFQEAIDAYRRADELHSKVASWLVDLMMAKAYAGLRDKEGTYKSLESLLHTERYFGGQGLYQQPTFAFVREEPRFQQLVGHVDAAAMSRTDGWRADIDLVIAELKRVNPVYHAENLPSEVLERSRKLREDVPNLTDDQIYAGLGHMLAPLDQGHTRVIAMPTSRSPVLTIPLKLYAFPEGIFVIASNDEKHVDLVGCEVTKIEGVPIAEVLSKVEAHLTVENRSLLFTVGLLQMRGIQFLRGIGIVPNDKETATFTLRNKQGDELERTVTAKAGELEGGKLNAAPGVAPPLSLRDISREHWFERVPDADALFVQVNQTLDSPTETLAAFGVRLREYLLANPTRNVILDVRHNDGGTTSLYTELLRTLIAHSIPENNRLYVIIGRGVYSATANLITDLERLARPVFVGEPSSGTGNQDGDAAFIQLPYSKLGVLLTSCRWQLSTPWDRRTSLVPDIPVLLTAEAYFAGRDPVLEVILQDLKRPARPPVPELP